MNILFWIFWFSNTLLTGILAGFMISNILQLSRFFTWCIESGNEELLYQSFTVFRETNTIQNTLYYSFLYFQFVIGIIWIVITFLSKRDRIEKIIAIIAGLATFWVGSIFFYLDVDEAEEAVLSGTADEAMKQLFVAINVPAHTSFAIIYFISFFLVLIIALKNIDFES